MPPTPGKARDYAPGEERYESHNMRTIYRKGYQSGLAGADPGHNPYSGSPRSIWESGRSRGREAAGGESSASGSPR
jgi:ribosome modulation factor